MGKTYPNTFEYHFFSFVYISLADGSVNSHYREEELIRSTTDVSGYRKTLKSLMPRNFVDQEVI
jgi:hypothetical protein